MAAQVREVINSWDLESSKPCTSLRHASAEELDRLGFRYDKTLGRWVILAPQS
jgi:hypothetical protein